MNSWMNVGVHSMASGQMFPSFWLDKCFQVSGFEVIPNTVIIKILVRVTGHAGIILLLVSGTCGSAV